MNSRQRRTAIRNKDLTVDQRGNVLHNNLNAYFKRTCQPCAEATASGIDMSPCFNEHFSQWLRTLGEASLGLFSEIAVDEIDGIVVPLIRAEYERRAEEVLLKKLGKL